MPKRALPELRDLVTEIVQRAHGGFVIRLSDPPTAYQRLQLTAARLQRSSFVIMPMKCATMDEWLGRYAHLSVARHEDLACDTGAPQRARNDSSARMSLVPL